MVHIAIVDTEDEFLALEDEWRELVSECPDLSYCLTWEYTRCMWTYFSAGRELWMLTARTDSGDLVGVAPWVIARDSFGPLRYRRLEFLTRFKIPFVFEVAYLDGEEVDIIAHPDYRDDVSNAFVPYLEKSRNRCDVVDLAWLSSDSPLLPNLRTTKALKLERTTSCAETPLPADWETYENDVLDRGLVKQNRYKARRLRRDYPDQVDFHRVDERSEVGAAIEELSDIKIEQFAEKGRVTSAEDDPHERAYRDFSRELAEAAFDRGWLRFYKLKVGDRTIASNFGIVVHDTYFLLNKGFDPDWKKHSPGYLLQAHEIQQAIDEGARRYDLGHGLTEIKRVWTHGERQDVRIIANLSWRGFPFFVKELVWTTWYPRARDLARRLLPEPLFNRVRNVVQGGTRTQERSTSSTSQGS